MDGNVQLFQDRWSAVREIEANELRSATPMARWKRLNAIIRLAMGMGIWGRAALHQKSDSSNWILLKENIEAP